MHPPLDILQSNLTEIFHAVKNSPPASLPLVSNISGTRIYDARYSWGRLWTWIYKVETWFTGIDRRLEKLKQAVKYTCSVFNECKQSSARALADYKHLLDNAGKGYSIDETLYLKARAAVNDWYAATRPFIRILGTPQAFRLKKVFEYSLGNAASSQFEDENGPALRQCKEIISLESTMEAPLPLPLLKKVIRNKPLNQTESKELVKWTGHVNTSGATVNQLHKALTALTEWYAKETQGANTALLELRLEQNGCTLFSGIDSKHAAWRSSLKPGSKVQINGREIRLGPELFPDDNGSDRTRAYLTPDAPGQVVLIAQNKAALKLRQLKMGSGAFMGINALQIDEVSKDGSAALVEKLIPMEQNEWGPSEKTISAVMEDKIDTLSTIIRTMISRRQTPMEFTSSSLLFNKKGELLSLKPLAPGPFDFNALEELALKWSAGNSIVFKHLMERSGLLECKEAKFYDDFLESTFSVSRIPLEDLAGVYKITDHKIVDRCPVLAAQALSIKSSLSNKLRALYPDKAPYQLAEMVGKAIIACKKKTCTAGMLWPNLERLVYEECANSRLPTA